MRLNLQTRKLSPEEAASLLSWLHSPPSRLFLQLLQSEFLLSQLEAGSKAIDANSNPNPGAQLEAREAVEKAERFNLMLEYITYLKANSEKLEIVTSFTPQDIT